jgi:large subunit ribosomal protein L17
MRHNVKGRKLGRTASHRLATLRTLATALLRYKKIKTTVAKAKETRVFVEPIITRAKTDSVHARRIVAEDIQDRTVVTELFNDIAKKVGDRPGGYTRIVKLGHRRGDAAEMAILELVDFNDLVAKKKAEDAKKKSEAKAKTKVDESKVEDAVVVEETKEVKKAAKKETKKEK